MPFHTPTSGTTRLVLTLALVAVASGAEGDGQPGGSAEAEDLLSQDPGFRALGVLESLKETWDRRLAACLDAFGHATFCTCLNNTLSLELTLDDYVVLVTRTKGDPAYSLLPADKQRLLDETLRARDKCVRRAVQQP